MLRRIGVAFIFVALVLPFTVAGQKGGHSSSSRSSSSRSSSSPRTTRSTSSRSKAASTKSNSASIPKKSTVRARTANGKIKRSAAARNEFMKQTGYPKGRKGYVVDHIVPLECGGADVPSNMQWQTKAEANIKDRTERNCRR